jgi:hypothetical protein
MKYWIQFIIMLVLAVSLPLEGLAAITMPLCSMSTMPMNETMAEGTHVDEITVQSQACDQNCQDCCVSQGSHDSAKPTGQKCFICHLSVIQLPVVTSVSAAPVKATKFPDMLHRNYQTFAPSLFRPPKSLSA